METLAKKAGKRFDSAGWLFWTVMFFLLLGPSIYMSYKAVWEDTAPFVVMAMGAIVSAILAGLVATTVNSVLQWKARRRAAERKPQTRKKAK